MRLAVERRLGRSLACRSDFTILASEIERVTREHIAENTLRRIWGRMKSYGTVFGRTLDVLSRYAGFDGWDAFCAHLREVAGIESDLVRDVRSVRTEDLRVGDSKCGNIIGIRAAIFGPGFSGQSVRSP